MVVPWLTMVNHMVEPYPKTMVNHGSTIWYFWYGQVGQTGAPELEQIVR